MAHGGDDTGEVRILLVDDHAILTEGIVSLLAPIPRFCIAGKAHNGDHALQILHEVSPHIVITDYSMDGMDGLTLIRNIRKSAPHIRVIVLTMHDEPAIVHDILRAGVDGYVLKKYTHHELQTAIEVVAEGGQFWSPEINRILLRRLQPGGTSALTSRELDVLKLLVNEKNSREIAALLFISERTVETHRKNLLRKTNATNVVGLIKYAHTHGIV